MNAPLDLRTAGPAGRPATDRTLLPLGGRGARALGLALLLALAGVPLSLRAQLSTPNPPGQVSYQGFLTDVNGLALGATAPTNYDVVFRIYTVPTGGTTNSLWTEIQTVTVDRGYFSVMLGQGAAYNNELWTNNLTMTFSGPNASDRYIGLTVRGLSNPDAEIQPRLRLVASPYAFLAANANTLIGSSGQPLVTSLGTYIGINKSNAAPASALDVNGTVTATGLNVSGPLLATSYGGNGGGLTNVSVAVNNIVGTLADTQLSANIARRAGGNLFTGTQTILGDLSLQGNQTVQQGLTVQGNTSLRGMTDTGTEFLSNVALTGNINVTPGSIGIGTTSPSAHLHVIGAAGQQLMLQEQSSGIHWSAYAERVQASIFGIPLPGIYNYYLYFQYQDGSYYAMPADGSGLVTGSDLRLKTDVTTLTPTLDRVLKLRPVAYRLKTASTNSHKVYGLIAQEVEPLFPEMVSEHHGMKGLSYTQLIPVSIAAIQELNQKVETDEREIQTLKREVNDLRQLVQGLVKGSAPGKP